MGVSCSETPWCQNKKKILKPKQISAQLFPPISENPLLKQESLSWKLEHISQSPVEPLSKRGQKEPSEHGPESPHSNPTDPSVPGSPVS